MATVENTSTDTPTVVTGPHIPLTDASFETLTPVVPYLIPYAAGCYAFLDAGAAAAFIEGQAALYDQLSAINAVLRDNRQITATP